MQKEGIEKAIWQRKGRKKKGRYGQRRREHKEQYLKESKSNKNEQGQAAKTKDEERARDRCDTRDNERAIEEQRKIPNAGEMYRQDNDKCEESAHRKIEK